MQISPCSVKVNRSTLQTAIVNLNHVPTKASWDLAVTQALRMIKGSQTELVKVNHSLRHCLPKQKLGEQIFLPVFLRVQRGLVRPMYFKSDISVNARIFQFVKEHTTCFPFLFTTYFELANGIFSAGCAGKMQQVHH